MILLALANTVMGYMTSMLMMAKMERMMVVMVGGVKVVEPSGDWRWRKDWRWRNWWRKARKRRLLVFNPELSHLRPNQ